MSLAQSMLPEFDHEMATTRKVLERVPDGKLDWKPHPKSYSLGGLASHLANIPRWTAMTLSAETFDVATIPADQANPLGSSRSEVLEMFDTSVTDARKAIAAASDETLMGVWTMMRGEQTMFSMPRVAVLRTFIMNHMIHHRGALCVYFRLLEVPVPSVYGPSADEGQM